MPAEIIIIDDKSTDETLSTILTFVDKHKNVLVLANEKNCGPAKTRNVGVEASSSELLFFVDSDTEADPRMLEIFLEQIEFFDAVVGVYSKVPINDGICPWYKSLLYSYMLSSENHAVAYDQFSASCAGIKKRVFQAVNGYDDWFVAGCDLENEELGYRIVAAGYRLFLIPNMKVAHRFPGFKRMLQTFFSRTALWVEMFCVRRRFSSVGGTKAMGISNVAAVLLALAAAGAYFHEFFLILVLLFSIIFLREYLPFYKFVRKERPKKLLSTIALSFIFAWSISLGAAYGLLKVSTGTSKIYQRFRSN